MPGSVPFLALSLSLRVAGAANLRVEGAAKVLVVGDSFGVGVGTSLASFCKGASVFNAAVSGTTAEQWTSDEVFMGFIGSAACGNTPDFIWLSVGGNDNFDTYCRSSVDELAAKITASINGVKQRAPSAKILMTGYCMPAGTTDIEACESPEEYHALGKALVQAAEADESVIYVDSTAACGGNESAWSRSVFFADTTHPNNKGNCAIITQAAVQDALGCESATYDCESVPSASPDFEHCAEDGSCRMEAGIVALLALLLGAS